MKRIIVSAISALALTAAFAAPAGAQDIREIVEISKPQIAISQVCYPGEKLDTCIIRVGREAPDTAFDLAAWALFVAGDALGDTIDTVEDACERYLSGCAAIPMP